MQKGLVIICEGNIGAGKTEFGKQFTKIFNYKLFKEPVEDNPYLEDYYVDPKKWALIMQLWLLAKRFKCHVEGINVARESIIGGQYNGVFFDRSVYGDAVFEQVNYEAGNISEEGQQENSIFDCNLTGIELRLFADIREDLSCENKCKC